MAAPGAQVSPDEPGGSGGSGGSGGYFDHSLRLPSGEIFRNLANAKRFAIDIGGSLTKLAYYATVQHKVARVHSSKHSKAECLYEISEQQEESTRLHFVRFENAFVEACLDFVKGHLGGPDAPTLIKATGGGAHKYKELIEKKLGLRVDKEDELECLIKGCNFLLRNIPHEAFSYCKRSTPRFRFQNTHPDIFPYLLVSVGSGVSVIKVESEESYERIGGSSIGGGTFWGLGALLTHTKNFDDLLALAAAGQHTPVDMLVRDIYGGNYGVGGLSGGIIASSFGKGATAQDGFEAEDMAKSLLHMISNNVGQLASLYAKLHSLHTVYFGGFFIREHPATMHSISFGINYWSKGEVQALFLRHEGYLGAIGAFLKGAKEDEPDQYSWGENYAGSSGLMSTSPELFPVARSRSGTFDMLEMDRLARLVPLPLLRDPQDYVPDSHDLAQDLPACHYWLSCFADSLPGVARRAVASQPQSPDAARRGELFRKKFGEKLQILRQQPWNTWPCARSAFGSLTVRSLLDTREHCQNEFHFPDPYCKVKQQENEAALRCYQAVVRGLDSLSWRERQLGLVRGLLAGNVFDWGAKAVTDVLESDPEFGFEEAKQQLQERPWLVDDYDVWLKRLQGSPHHCALIFVDNSGADIVLGVLPFVRELLSHGTEVILAANSGPALNDVTSGELSILTARVAEMDPRICSALSNDQLVVVQSGSSSPCLDLSRLDEALVTEVENRKVDLLLIEGMGRAVHTNLRATFLCDILKVAVLKNAWLAQRLGGQLYSVVFKYEPS